MWLRDQTAAKRARGAWRAVEVGTKDFVVVVSERRAPTTPEQSPRFIGRIGHDMRAIEPIDVSRPPPPFLSEEYKPMSSVPPEVVKVTIAGIAPGLLLCNGNCATLDVQEELARLRERNRGGEEAARQYRQAVMRFSLYQQNGIVVLPQSMLGAALLAGLKLTKKNKMDVQWKAQFASSVVLNNPPLLLPEFDFKPVRSETVIDDDRFIDIRQGRNPTTGSMLPHGLIRPFFQSWRADVKVEIDPFVLDEDALRAAFEAAGRQVGIGSWRPSSPKPGHFGRFVVVSVEAMQARQVAIPA
jgi:hypothetical protein